MGRRCRRFSTGVARQATGAEEPACSGLKAHPTGVTLPVIRDTLGGAETSLVAAVTASGPSTLRTMASTSSAGSGPMVRESKRLVAVVAHREHVTGRDLLRRDIHHARQDARLGRRHRELRARLARERMDYTGLVKSLDLPPGFTPLRS